MSKADGRHCIVSGRVQGVWYRGSTLKKAQELGISGRVKNLENGAVEVLMYGDKNKLDELIEWLWQGPKLAQVKGIKISTTPFEAIQGFTISYE